MSATFLVVFVIGIARIISAYPVESPDQIALADCERQAPPCADEATLLHKLASHYRMEARYADAKALYEKALTIDEASYGESDPKLINVLSGLALLEREIGEIRPASQLVERALAILRSHGLNESAEAGDCYATLGQIRYDQARMSEARAAYEHATDIRVHKFGANDPKVAEVQIGLGVIYRLEGRAKQAEGLYRRALVTLERNDPLGERAIALNNLAQVLAERGKWMEAREDYRAAIMLWEKEFGSDHPNVGTALTSLAAMLHEHRLETEAEQLARRALQIADMRRPAGHAETGRAAVTLAEICAANRNFPEASDLYSRGLEILAAAWGPEDTRLLPWLDHYVQALRVREEYAEAEKVRLKATRIRVTQALKKNSANRGG
jgi:tetratricopeptide (TPR) repeat protein